MSKLEYPKMVYKNEKTEIVQHKDEVGYANKIVKSEEELKKLGSEWGDHPELEKSDFKVEMPEVDTKAVDSDESAESVPAWQGYKTNKKKLKAD